MVFMLAVLKSEGDTFLERSFSQSLWLGDPARPFCETSIVSAVPWRFCFLSLMMEAGLLLCAESVAYQLTVASMVAGPAS